MGAEEKFYHQEGKEGRLEIDRHIEAGIEHALAQVRKDFEDAPEEKDRLPFHNTHHSRDVARRTELILSTIRQAAPHLVSEHDVKIGKLAGAFHDVKQRWEENRIQEGAFTKVMRKRFAGENEAKSADAAIAFMERANRESGKEIFSKDDKKVLREAIDATIPGFNPEKGTVVQPNMNRESPAIVRAVALADLGTAGMDGPEKFIPEGDALFREENLDILEAMKNPDGIPDSQKEYFRKRMISWSASQSKFAEGRRALLDAELDGLPAEAQEKVRELFTHFDTSIEAATQKTARRASMSFEALAADMGYQERNDMDELRDGKRELTEREAEIVKELERLPIRPMYFHNIVDVLLAWRGLKPATDVVLGREWASNEEAKILTEADVENAKRILGSAGLSVVEGAGESGEIEGEDDEGRPVALRPLYRYDQKVLFISRAREIAEKLKQAHEQDDSRTFGELSGFPATAIEAYVRAEQGAADELMDTEELPKKIKDKDVAAFTEFRLSKKHWREEIKTAQRWAEEIQRISPRVYEKIVRH